MDRRQFVTTGASAAAVGIAGCLGGGGGSEGGSRGQPPFASHPATEGIDGTPLRGPSDAPAKIVAFEDPSCPACRRFETQTWPELEGDVESGDLAFYFRGYPVVYPWGEPASAILEAVYSRDEDAFWALKDHYYQEQGSFPGRAEMNQERLDAIHRRSAEFLADETDVDAQEAVGAARGGEHEGAVDTDLRVGRRIGVEGTPSFVLFRDGDYVTAILGPQDYSVFANALGL